MLQAGGRGVSRAHAGPGGGLRRADGRQVALGDALRGGAPERREERFSRHGHVEGAAGRGGSARKRNGRRRRAHGHAPEEQGHEGAAHEMRLPLRGKRDGDQRAGA